MAIERSSSEMIPVAEVLCLVTEGAVAEAQFLADAVRTYRRTF